MLTIAIWPAYSCNNSTSYRLVARFTRAEEAQAAATELRAFFEEAAPLNERRPRRGLTTATSFPAVEAMDVVASSAGFDWTELIVSGVYDDELAIAAEGTTLLVFHPYTLGLGAALPAYFRAKGAEIESRPAIWPSVSVICTTPTDALRNELEPIFAQALLTRSVSEWERPLPWALPNGAERRSANTAFFFDGQTMGFYSPIDPEEIRGLKDYLQTAGIERPRIRLCEEADLANFLLTARARCLDCDLPLRFLDRHEHGIAMDQLGCFRCGGMFDFASFGSAT